MIQIVTNYFQHRAWAKNGSFGFAKGRLVCRAKLNVPLLQLAFLFVFVMVVGRP
jgi:hypothetical protein